MNPGTVWNMQVVLGPAEVIGIIDKMMRWQVSKLCRARYTSTSMHQLSHCKLLKHTLHDHRHVSGFTFLCAVVDIRREGLCEDG